MEDIITRFLSDLVGRLHGPFSFRFVLQPVMAVLYAARDGVLDARQGRPPYFWTIFTGRRDRWDLLREGQKAVARVIALGVVMDVIYQLMEFHWVHPIQLLVIVLALAFVPYVILRGPVNRIARAWMTRKIRT